MPFRKRIHYYYNNYCCYYCYYQDDDDEGYYCCTTVPVDFGGDRFAGKRDKVCFLGAEMYSALTHLHTRSR